MLYLFVFIKDGKDINKYEFVCSSWNYGLNCIIVEKREKEVTGIQFDTYVFSMFLWFP